LDSSQRWGESVLAPSQTQTGPDAPHNIALHLRLRVPSVAATSSLVIFKKPAWSGFFGQSREHKYTCLLWNSCHDLPVVIDICSAEFNGGLDDYLQPVADVIFFRER
jgi:hypothetical protein